MEKDNFGIQMALNYIQVNLNLDYLTEQGQRIIQKNHQDMKIIIKIITWRNIGYNTKDYSGKGKDMAEEY